MHVGVSATAQRTDKILKMGSQWSCVGQTPYMVPDGWARPSMHAVLEAVSDPFTDGGVLERQLLTADFSLAWNMIGTVKKG